MATKAAVATKAAPKEEPKAEAPKGKRFQSKWPRDHVITLLVDYNPKRAGSESAARFENYEDEMTVKEALDAGLEAGDLNWDVKHGFIKIDRTFDAKADKKSKPEPKARKAKAEEAEEEEETPVKGKAKAAPAKKGKAKIEEEEEEC